MLPSWFWNDTADPMKQMKFDLYIFAVLPAQVNVTVEVSPQQSCISAASLIYASQLFNEFYMSEMDKFKNTITVSTFRPKRSNTDPLEESFDFAFYAFYQEVMPMCCLAGAVADPGWYRKSQMTWDLCCL